MYRIVEIVAIFIFIFVIWLLREPSHMNFPESTNDPTQMGAEPSNGGALRFSNDLRDARVSSSLHVAHVIAHSNTNFFFFNDATTAPRNSDG